MTCCCGRQELQRRYERVLLLGMDVANQRTVEQQLWRSVYYNVIEGLRRQQVPDNSSLATVNKQALSEILDEVGVMFMCRNDVSEYFVFWCCLCRRVWNLFGFRLIGLLNSLLICPDAAF